MALDYETKFVEQFCTPFHYWHVKVKEIGSVFQGAARAH